MLGLDTFLPLNDLMTINIITIFLCLALLLWSIRLKIFLLYHLQHPKNTDIDILNRLDFPRVLLSIRSCIIGVWFGLSFYLICYIAK